MLMLMLMLMMMVMSAFIVQNKVTMISEVDVLNFQKWLDLHRGLLSSRGHGPQRSLFSRLAGDDWERSPGHLTQGPP